MKKVLSVLCMALLAGGMIFTSCTKTYTITTATNVDAWGTVTGGGTYAEGAEVTLKAVPAVGYVFVEWTDGVKDNPRTITVTGDALYTAHFRKASREVKVTFKNNTWSAGSIDGSILSDNVTWSVFAEQTANDYPKSDVCMATTEETTMYNRCNSQTGELTSPNFQWIDYYETGYMEDSHGVKSGDWWAYNATVQIYEFDATNLEVNADVDATMFAADNAFDPEYGAVGVENATRASMKEEIINIKLNRSTKDTPMRKSKKMSGKLVKKS